MTRGPLNDPLIGRQLANFRIERLLGQGGMAQVYFGHDVKLQRPVAIKVIDASFRDNVSYAERFVREARTVAQWRHENILQIYYADEEDGLYYYAMEYIDGMDLAQLIASYSSVGELMPHEDVLRIGYAVARALDYAHSQGVIHRDVKPSNVMIATDDRVVLTDFGLALDVEQGTMGEVFGTPHYIAPEQARRSSDAVPQSDIYAWGVVLYELLTGAVPFDDPSPTSLALQHLTMPPPPPREVNPALSEETENVLLKALDKDPTKRYQTANTMLTALDQALSSAQKTDTPTALPPVPAEVQDPPLAVSRMTVTERVSEYVAATHTPAAFPEPLVAQTQHYGPTPAIQREPVMQATAKSSPVESPRRNRGLMVIAVVGAIVVMAGALFLVFGNRDNEPSDETLSVAADTTQTATLEVTPTEPLPTATFNEQVVAAVASDTPSASPTVPPTVSPSATETSTLTNTPTNPPKAIPTEIPTDVPTDLPPPIVTFTLQPTGTVLPTATMTALPTEPLEATVPYPNGRRFVLYYDETALFMSNSYSERSEVRPFAFERLDTSGNPLTRAEGSRWSRFYGFIYPGSCIKIIILDQPAYFSPLSCQGINSEVWAESGSDLDFWTPQANSDQFRVLWNGEEIGRCEINAGECEVFAP